MFIDQIYFSGGHTAEMIELLRVLSTSKYEQKYYFIAETDKISEKKVRVLEEEKPSKEVGLFLSWLNFFACDK